MKLTGLYFIIIIILTIMVSVTDLCADNKALQKLADISDGLEAIAEKVSPAVVQIQSVTYQPLLSGYVTSSDLLAKQRSSGSGAIVDPDGYIITNAHVVAGATRVTVMRATPPALKDEYNSILKPRGNKYEAKIIGLDFETDLAVLKIDDLNLPYLELADSDLLRQGQLVIAFGSPLGLDNSVTMGVVSSVARQLQPEDRMIYIQTDAPINPGNSGGPLVDHSGKIVGINTLIMSQGGGSEGIGFAAPSNIVGNVYNQIRKNGFVRRGMIGVSVQTITPTLAEGLGLRQDWGVIVSDVFPESPAESAGIQTGDIIKALNLKTMENGRQFNVNLYRWEIGDEIKLDLIREGREISVRVAVTEPISDPGRFAEMVTPEKNLVSELGLLILNLDDNLLPMLPNIRKDFGVVVAARSYDSPQFEGGLYPGDVIYSVNSQPIAGIVGLRSSMRSLEAGDAVVMQIDRNGRLMYISFEME